MQSADKKIAILGFDTLQSCGFCHILKNFKGIECYCENDWYEKVENFSAFIITPTVLMSNLDLFLPKKSRLLVCNTSENVPSPNETSIKIVSIFASIEEIAEAVNSLVEAINDTSYSNELSIREMEVLKEIASGKIIKEIADTLNISVNTVLTHRKNISAKLGIRSVSGLSLYAMMNGLIK